MKKGDIFINPRTNKTCEITRFYGNKSWYYKELESNKEVRSTIDASNIKPIKEQKTFDYFEMLGKIEQVIGDYKPIPNGAKVKLNIDELKKSNLGRTQVFDDFVSKNHETIFTVQSTTPHIVSLEETYFTFWEHHLIVVEPIEN